MRRPALIFDFGNVIAYFDFGRATARLGERAGLAGPDLLDRLRPVGLGALLRDYERGKIAAVSFAEQFAGLAGLVIPHEEFVAAWTDIFTPNESIIPLIAHLKAQGHPLILGSNTNDMHSAHFRTQFAATLRHFDRLVLSHEVGEVKPHRDFYLACAAAAGLAPGDCVFIDDLAENVAGAQAAGLVGLVYESTPDLIGKLELIGVDAEPAGRDSLEST